MLIAQLSDLHIKTAGRLAYGRVDTAAMLKAAVAHLMAQNPLPDVVVVTGDLVDYGKDEEYALLRELLDPITLPMLLLPGNHDERAALRRAFASPRFSYLQQGGTFVQYAVTLGTLRFVALDTVIPGEGAGRVCVQRLAWLDQTLGADATPTVVLMHHPPFDTGIAHMDRLGLDGSAALEDVITRHPHVERLLCGHLHRPIQCRFGGSVASTCPSTAHQVALDLTADGPDVFIMEPPGYQLHRWHAGRLVSHTVVLGEFAGPFPFRMGGKLIDA